MSGGENRSAEWRTSKSSTSQVKLRDAHSASFLRRTSLRCRSDRLVSFELLRPIYCHGTHSAILSKVQVSHRLDNPYCHSLCHAKSCPAGELRPTYVCRRCSCTQVSDRGKRCNSGVHVLFVIKSDKLKQVSEAIKVIVNAGSDLDEILLHDRNYSYQWQRCSPIHYCRL